MRLREAVASALHLLVILSFAVLAFFSFLMPSRPDWRFMAIDCLEKSPENFYWICGGFACFAFLLLLGFYKIGRGRFLRISMKPHLAMVDVKLIEQVVEECFQSHFPSYVRGTDVAVVNQQHLEVVIDLIPIEEKQQVQLMKDAEKKLCQLLRNRFGYVQPFNLSVHSR